MASMRGSFGHQYDAHRKIDKQTIAGRQEEPYYIPQVVKQDVDDCDEISYRFEIKVCVHDGMVREELCRAVPDFSRNQTVKNQLESQLKKNKFYYIDIGTFFPEKSQLELVNDIIKEAFSHNLPAMPAQLMLGKAIGLKKDSKRLVVSLQCPLLTGISHRLADIAKKRCVRFEVEHSNHELNINLFDHDLHVSSQNIDVERIMFLLRLDESEVHCYEDSAKEVTKLKYIKLSDNVNEAIKDLIDICKQYKIKKIFFENIHDKVADYIINLLSNLREISTHLESYYRSHFLNKALNCIVTILSDYLNLYSSVRFKELLNNFCEKYKNELHDVRKEYGAVISDLLEALKPKSQNQTTAPFYANMLLNIYKKENVICFLPVTSRSHKPTL